MSFKTLCSSVARACRPSTVKRKAAVAFAALSLSTACTDGVKPRMEYENPDSTVFSDVSVRDAQITFQDAAPDTGRRTPDTSVPDTGTGTQDAGNRLQDAGLPDAMTPSVIQEPNGRMLFKETIKKSLNDRGDLSVNEDGVCNESFLAAEVHYSLAAPETSIDLAHPFSNNLGGSLVEGIPTKLFKLDASNYDLLADQRITPDENGPVTALQMVFIGGYSDQINGNPSISVSPLIYQVKFIGNEDSGLDFHDFTGEYLDVPITLGGMAGSITGYRPPTMGRILDQTEVVHADDGIIEFTYATNDGSTHLITLHDGQQVHSRTTLATGQSIDVDLDWKVTLGWRQDVDGHLNLRSILIYLPEEFPQILSANQGLSVAGFGNLQFEVLGLEAEHGYDTLQIDGVDEPRLFRIQTPQGLEDIRAEAYLQVRSSRQNAFLSSAGMGDLIVIPLGYSTDDITIGARSIFLFDILHSPVGIVVPAADDDHDQIRYGLGYTTLGPRGPAQPSHLESNVLVISKGSSGFESPVFDRTWVMMLEDSAISNTPSQGSVDGILTTFVQGLPYLTGQYENDGNIISYVSPFAGLDLHHEFMCGIDQTGSGGRLMGQGEYTHRGTYLRILDGLRLEADVPIQEPAQLKFGLRLIK